MIYQKRDQKKEQTLGPDEIASNSKNSISEIHQGESLIKVS